MKKKERKPRAAKQTKAVAVRQEQPVDTGMISSLVLNGDLSKFTPDQKTQYYIKLCKSLQLNPYTQPFALLNLSGKQVLYVQKSGTDQLRKIHGVSVESIVQNIINDICVTTVTVKDRAGRVDGATGPVNIAGLKGDNLANAMMKSETKAKRRATLSICGLGMLDESETETISGAAHATIDINGAAATPDKSSTSDEESAKASAIAAAKKRYDALPDYIRDGFKNLGYTFIPAYQFCEDHEWDAERIRKDIDKIADKQRPKA